MTEYRESYLARQVTQTRAKLVALDKAIASEEKRFEEAKANAKWYWTGRLVKLKNRKAKLENTLANLTHTPGHLDPQPETLQRILTLAATDYKSSHPRCRIMQAWVPEVHYNKWIQWKSENGQAQGHLVLSGLKIRVWPSRTTNLDEVLVAGANRYLTGTWTIPPGDCDDEAIMLFQQLRRDGLGLEDAASVVTDTWTAG